MLYLVNALRANNSRYLGGVIKMKLQKVRKKFSLHPDAYEALVMMEEQTCLSQSDIVSIAILQQEIRETIDSLPQVGQKGLEKLPNKGQ